MREAIESGYSSHPAKVVGFNALRVRRSLLPLRISRYTDPTQYNMYNRQFSPRYTKEELEDIQAMAVLGGERPYLHERCDGCRNWLPGLILVRPHEIGRLDLYVAFLCERCLEMHNQGKKASNMVPSYPYKHQEKDERWEDDGG